MKNLNSYDELALIKKALTSQNFESHFDKHDNTHIEAEMTYNKVNKHFLIETYFFLPQTMGFYQKGFSAKKFLQSTTNFIRLKSPEMLPSEFLDLNNPTSPLSNLLSLKNEMLLNPDKNFDHEVLEKTKTAGNFILHFLKTLTKEYNFKKDYDLNHHYQKEVEVFNKILFSFREILQNYENIFSNKHSYLVLQMYYVDEYLSYVLENKWARVLRNLKDTITFETKEEIIKILSREVEYRSKRNYLSPFAESEENQEIFVYKLGLLKKFIQSSLYLEVKARPFKEYAVQAIAMIAAGIAAVFAYSIEYYQRARLGLNWGINTGFLIGISTVAYMFKDRIKDVIKLALGKRIWSEFDASYDIFLHEKSKEPIGKVKERVQFHKDTLEIDKKVWDTRYTQIYTGLDRDKIENVIHYKKIISVNWENLEKQIPEFLPEIKEIYRFDIADWLSSLDDPQRSFNVFDTNENDEAEIFLPKVYHINAVFSVLPLVSEKLNVKENLEANKVYHRVKIIIDKSGIKRMAALQ